ncbi:MAG: ZIP family metal transporter [Candidatus Pacearchaeota archaeon]
MSVLFYIIISTFLISLIAFIGIITFALREKLLEKLLLVLVALSAGALMGGAFLHLIPEAIERFTIASVFIYLLIGFSLFFLIEKVLHWRHCHKGKCKIHSFAHMNLIGESVHNFIDGLIIAASFVINLPLGIASTIAVAMHEIPQEIGDFGVLVYGGYKKGKALMLNFFVALSVVLGGIFGYFFLEQVNALTGFLIPFAAGGFIYIAASDLIPELRRETEIDKSLTTFGVFIIGLAIMLVVRVVGG